MIKNIESFLESAGKYSCYFDCLLKIAEDYTGFNFDYITTVQMCSTRYVNKTPYLTFNWNDYTDKANFDVNYPALILELLTGKKWTVTKEPANYKPKRGDIIVECWVNGGRKHFRMKDYDPLQNSVTVKEGHIDSYRVFRLA